MPACLLVKTYVLWMLCVPHLLFSACCDGMLVSWLTFDWLHDEKRLLSCSIVLDGTSMVGCPGSHLWHLVASCMANGYLALGCPLYKLLSSGWFTWLAFDCVVPSHLVDSWHLIALISFRTLDMNLILFLLPYA